MNINDCTVGKIVITPAYVIRRGIDRMATDWKIRARIIGQGPGLMLKLRSLDRELNSVIPRGTRTLFRSHRDLSAVVRPASGR